MTAVEYFQLSIELGCTKACRYIVNMCYYGKNGAPQDYAKAAIALYQYLADRKASNKNGCSWGACMPGKVYDEGICREKDDEKARRCYELAASLGSKEAWGPGFPRGFVFPKRPLSSDDRVSPLCYSEPDAQRGAPEVLLEA